MDTITFKDKPRTGMYADEIGAYHLASRVFSKTINPGETFKFEQYITGYGDIRNSKIQCYISSEIFDKENSCVINSLKKDGNKIGFGNQSNQIDDEGFTCYLSGVQADNWDESTLFFDKGGDSKGSKSVFTESKAENAPFFYKLKLKNDVKPGDYSITFYFTYYDGHRWQCSKETVDLKVRNFFEKHAKIISSLAIIATSLSIIRFGFLPLAKWFFS
ncbi:hypothetical protein [Photobacterium phosphoreum]|uniref:hypothetical protein n=1 Tax=Photobacterium phosphoreum TaxID=659 RepID=UPI001E2C5AEF|nr:hypothetical protein [Photobacterium phosphoreum]MCD9506126.1 hypothetical protein [Photobacterium phosphoreum]